MARCGQNNPSLLITGILQSNYRYFTAERIPLRYKNSIGAPGGPENRVVDQFAEAGVKHGGVAVTQLDIHGT